MIAEHTFITTLSQETTMQRARMYLELNKFKIREANDSKITAVRGRKVSNHPKLERLPQFFEFSFDRGRVTLAFSAILYRNKKKPIHPRWLTAFMADMENILSEPDENAVVCNRFRMIERSHKCGPCLSDVLLGFLIFILILLAFLAVIAMID